MAGHKNFKALSDRIDADPERRVRIEQLGRVYDAVLTLADLRSTRGITQAALAEALDVPQANISRLEHGQDLYLSTLARCVKALVGRLEPTAVFPDERVTLSLPGS